MMNSDRQLIIMLIIMILTGPLVAFGIFALFNLFTDVVNAILSPYFSWTVSTEWQDSIADIPDNYHLFPTPESLEQFFLAYGLTVITGFILFGGMYIYSSIQIKREEKNKLNWRLKNEN